MIEQKKQNINIKMTKHMKLMIKKTCKSFGIFPARPYECYQTYTKKNLVETKSNLTIKIYPYHEQQRTIKNISQIFGLSVQIFIYTARQGGNYNKENIRKEFENFCEMREIDYIILYILLII
jgi:hypothetical protein